MPDVNPLGDVANTKAKKLTYSLRTLADFKGKILESHFEGTDLIINGREVMVHFVGRFNAYNLLAVVRSRSFFGERSRGGVDRAEHAFAPYPVARDDPVSARLYGDRGLRSHARMP